MDKVDARKLFRGKAVNNEISESVNGCLNTLIAELSPPLVLSYSPLSDEIKAPLFSHMALPFIRGDEMEFALYKGKLVKGKYGIAEPEEKEALTAFPEGAVILAPALAFDKNGFRVGRGKGYYDRYLSRFPSLVKIGLCPSERIVEIDDIREEDSRMDLIITEEGILYF